MSIHQTDSTAGASVDSVNSEQSLSNANGQTPVAPSPSKRPQGIRSRLFQRRKDNDLSNSSKNVGDSSPETQRASYAEDIRDLPPRPPAFVRVLQQIRSMPNMRKAVDNKSTRPVTTTKAATLPVHRTKSGGSDSGDVSREGSRSRAGSSSAVDFIDSRPSSDREEESTENIAVTNSVVTDDSALDEVDSGPTPDPLRAKAMIEHYQQKILRIKEQIKAEQTARDENVNEYLKLAEHADKQQIARIKTVFEKKNQKSNSVIAQQQKKLEKYQERIRDLEANGAPPRKPKEVLQGMHLGLKGVGANIRDGITGFSGGVADNIRGGLSGLSEFAHTAGSAVVSKPKEFAHLIKNKFGSADNIDTIKDLEDEGTDQNRVVQARTPAARNLKLVASLSAPHPIRGRGHSVPTIVVPKFEQDLDDRDDTSSMTSGSVPMASSPTANHNGTMPMANLEPILAELQEMRDAQNRLQEAMENIKVQMQTEYSFFNQALQEERYRYERLEEQLNDLTELHQNEMMNLKQELASMEEKVEYQSDERARDIQDALEQCQTRISKMELAQQQQQVITLEGYENANARALLTKLINVILAVLAVILVFVSTVANLITPFMKTRLRVLSTVIISVVIAILWKIGRQ
ncbi:transmembrane and coiled-coil domains protein 2-like isoform X7 [Ptychodera flava]|uniref:transmembrane and coiled-coil domains protein 2-like isoform X7 n=1 Tax=Ptychodera flava TaxID=63121 RepID=UPI003969F8D7